MSSTTAERLAQLYRLAETLPENDGERKQIAEAAKALARAAEPLYYQTQRLVYSNLVLAVVRVAVDLDLFKHLSTPVGKAHDTDKLAALTKADPLLLSMLATNKPPVEVLTDWIVRILRFLATYNIIDEPSPGAWAGSFWTQDIAEEGNLNGIKHQYVIETSPHANTV